MSQEQINLLLAAKQENPKRSVKSLKRVMELMQLPTRASCSTLRRVLKQHEMGRGYSATRPKVLLPMNFTECMEVWMGDFSPGLFLPHPIDPKKMARIHLCMWFDPVGSMVVGARYFWSANQFNGICTLKEAIVDYGLPRRLYVDNGELAGNQMMLLVANLGIAMSKGIPGRKEGRAHCERMFQTVQHAFESEFKAYPVTSLQEVNHRLNAWLKEYWNMQENAKGQTLLQAYLNNRPPVRHLTREQYSYFLFQKSLKVGKNGLVKVEGVNFWVDPPLANSRVTVRYNPDDLSEIEVWSNGRKDHIAYPFDPNNQAYKLCRQMTLRPKEPSSGPKVCDFLGELVKSNQKTESEMDSGANDFLVTLEHLLKRSIDPIQKQIVMAFWNSYGPLSFSDVEQALKRFIETKGSGLHIDIYLERLRQLPRGKEE